MPKRKLTEQEAIEKARSTFLTGGNSFGCAETTFMVLKEIYGLPDAHDSSAAMSLNGGVAYSGGVCGAISGAALAVGMLAERRIPDHKQAKRAARRIIAALMDDFESAHGSVNCRDLIGMELRDEEKHHRFIANGLWRTRCMSQIEFSIHRLYDLIDEGTWAVIIGQ